MLQFFNTPYETSSSRSFYMFLENSYDTQDEHQEKKKSKTPILPFFFIFFLWLKILFVTNNYNKSQDNNKSIIL